MLHKNRCSPNGQLALVRSEDKGMHGGTVDQNNGITKWRNGFCRGNDRVRAESGCLTSSLESTPFPAVGSLPGPARGIPAVMAPLLDLLGLQRFRSAQDRIIQTDEVSKQESYFGVLHSGTKPFEKATCRSAIRVSAGQKR